MQVSGVDKLLRKFRKMYKDIDDDVDFILKNNANEGVEIAIKMRNMLSLKATGRVI